MATNFTITEKKQKPTPGGHYVMEREYKKEARKVAELEKELKAHEKSDKEMLHPPMSHEANQSAAALPNMRKY